MNNAKAVYDMLAVQYKPVERDLLRRIKGTEAEKMYKNASYAKKISVIEWHARKLGLG